MLYSDTHDDDFATRLGELASPDQPLEFVIEATALVDRQARRPLLVPWAGLNLTRLSRFGVEVVIVTDRASETLTSLFPRFPTLSDRKNLPMLIGDDSSTTVFCGTDLPPEVQPLLGKPGILFVAVNEQGDHLGNGTSRRALLNADHTVQGAHGLVDLLHSSITMLRNQVAETSLI